MGSLQFDMVKPRGGSPSSNDERGTLPTPRQVHKISRFIDIVDGGQDFNRQGQVLQAAQRDRGHLVCAPGHRLKENTHLQSGMGAQA